MAPTSRMMHTEESAEVEVLLANMEKLKNLTKKIGSSLNTLDTSGKGVQSSIRPIYGNTGRLQSANTNIEGIRKAISKIRAELVERRVEEPVIRGGIRNTQLEEYMGAMDRTGRTMANLRTNNLKSNQQAVAELTDLLAYGGREMEGLFREVLDADSAPVEPLHYLTKGKPFPSIAAENVSTLRRINAYMITSPVPIFRSTNGDPRTAQIYAEVRGPYIQKTLHNLAMASTSTVKKTDPSAIYRQGQSGIGTYCKAVEDLFNAEYNSICEVFAREQWMPVHTATCFAATREFADTLKALHTHLLQYPITDCFLAYEILDLVQALSVRLGAHNPDQRKPIDDGLRPIKAFGKASVQTLLEDSKNKILGIVALPNDASAIQPTYDAMTRLQAMTGYLIPLGGLLAARGDSHFDVGVDSESLFSAYMAETIEAVLNALDSKAHTSLKNKAAQSIFMANNIAVIDRHLISPYFSLIPMDGPRQKLGPWRKKGIKAYVDTWADLVRNLQDQVHTGRSTGSGLRPPSGNPGDSSAFLKSLSNKEREGIKERFKNFNNQLDELVRRHTDFKIEPEVRAEVAREISELVQPFYDRFWDRYHEIDKGKGKHAKFDKSGLNSQLALL